MTPVIPFWPNVYASTDSNKIVLDSNEGRVTRQVIKQGMAGGTFANLLLGWAFET